MHAAFPIFFFFFFFFFFSKDTAQGQTKRGKKSPLTCCSLQWDWSEGRSISVAEVSWYSPLEGIQVIDRRKYRGRKAVPEFTSGKEDRVTVLVHSCKRDLDSIGVSLCRKTSMTRTREEGRHAGSKFRRAVSLKIAIKNEREATSRWDLRGRRELVREGDLMRRKAFDSTLFNRAVCVEPPHTWHTYSIQGRTRPLYIVKQLIGGEKWLETVQNA